MCTVFIFVSLFYIVSHVRLSYVIKGFTYLLTYRGNIMDGHKDARADDTKTMMVPASSNGGADI